MSFTYRTHTWAMYFKISECFDTYCTCILGDLAVLKSAFQGPKSGHRGVGEATLGTVSGSGLSKYGQNEVKLLHRNL